MGERNLSWNTQASYRDTLTLIIWEKDFLDLSGPSEALHVPQVQEAQPESPVTLIVGQPQ
ncbi:hypothetical protein BZM27_16250 [Paraburkholderia steynii]|uniref:Uncharacterized protein n=1 Tax=Paraburkholderia steynii TaxID=1245441 RepID=A0A4R0XN59_9BURK|nr:hypothetical protein BZM27_16250 [Paraburkholderia steynii]